MSFVLISLMCFIETAADNRFVCEVTLSFNNRCHSRKASLKRPDGRKQMLWAGCKVDDLKYSCEVAASASQLDSVSKLRLGFPQTWVCGSEGQFVKHQSEAGAWICDHVRSCLVWMLHFSSSQSGQGFVVLAQRLKRTGKAIDMNERGNTTPFSLVKHLV